jgi:hypothetical protein
VVRAIVSDANDSSPFQPEPTYLDSDGQLGSNAANRTPSHAGAAPPLGAAEEAQAAILLLGSELAS